MMMRNNPEQILYQDQPIDPEALVRMQTNIMSFIQSNPVNFAQKLDLQKRRKWGLVALIFILGFGLLLSVGLWFLGDPLMNVFRQLILRLASIGPVSWLIEKANLVTELKTGLQIMWQTYSTALMALLGMWVIAKGIEMENVDGRN